MGFVIFAFAAIFLLIASGGLLLFYREQILQRITTVITPRKEQPKLKNILQQTGTSLSSVVEQFERVAPKSQAEMSVVQMRLTRAGYRDEAAIKIFYGSKVLVPLVLGIAVFFSPWGNVFISLGAVGIGFLMPDFWLGRRIARRQKKIRLGMPDVLDLLVICIEAGLSLDQAVSRTVKELFRAIPEFCDELGLVVLEQRAGRARSDAWKNMADRTDVDCVRNLVTILVQSEQFGTGIAKTLRIHSDTLRTERIQMVEEQAAKTTIKLIFPLVLFIFPSLFLVTLGPAVILMSESFQNFFH